MTTDRHMLFGRYADETDTIDGHLVEEWFTAKEPTYWFFVTDLETGEVASVAADGPEAIWCDEADHEDDAEPCAHAEIIKKWFVA